MTTWQQDPRVLSHRSGDRVVVIAPAGEDPVVLEASAAIVWTLLADPVEEQALFALVADSFGVSVATVAADVTSFLHELCGIGAVATADPATNRCHAPTQ
jgi:hypothetical protein